MEALREAGWTDEDIMDIAQVAAMFNFTNRLASGLGWVPNDNEAVWQVAETGLVYVIRDEGPGFDVSGLPDPTDPANLDRPCGRGMLLMRTFMDNVIYNDRGNEVTLFKERETEPDEIEVEEHGVRYLAEVVALINRPEEFTPAVAHRIEHYQGERPLFDLYGVEDLLIT